MRPDPHSDHFDPYHALNESSGFHRSRAMRPSREAPHRSRFVTESHALGAPFARPSSLLFAATIAVALLLIGHRLTH